MGLRESLALGLKLVLEEKGISQSELARKAGLSFQTINGLACGRSSFSCDTITRLAKVLKINESDLFVWNSQKKSA